MDNVSANIETIAALHASSERSVTPHQRVIETITGHLGRPISLYFMIAFVALWTGVNIYDKVRHIAQFDPPPFSFLQGVLGFSALLVSTMVLITQNRQARIADQRSHLDIQVNLLAEQKITKLISLVEELRKDLPNVRNREDLEAELMTQSTDPLAVVEEIQKKFETTEALYPKDPDNP
jgi:uncharacterized membrane protein